MERIISMKTHEDKIKEIVAYYGYEAQSRQLIDEMAELTQAVNKLWRINKGYKLADSTTKKMYFDNVIEEIADVEVCLSYVKTALDIKSEQIDRVKSYKVDREIQRIAANKEQ